MTDPREKPVGRQRLKTFLRDEEGATLIEFSMVILVFLFLIFAIIDMGRLAHTWAAAQKATQIAARVASVRAPVCAGVPDTNVRGTATSNPVYGTLCRAAVGVCAEPAASICTGAATHPTATEIMTAISPLLPAGSTAANLRFTYSFDRNLGFLGGPYVPMVTVDLVGVRFNFVSNLGAMIAPITGTTSTLGAGIALPAMSISVPGEDLAPGTDG